MTSPPKWYLPVTIFALLWNLLGCIAYLSDVMLTPEDVARMSVAQQSLYASRSAWAVAATAIASGSSLTTSRMSPAYRSAFPSAYRYSTARVWPST